MATKKNVNSGKINVTADNIFPIIKKFLYSDHEIFLRELVSNAVDATQKIKTLGNIGEYKGEINDLSISVTLEKDKERIIISDHGLGMTEEEVKKYINEVAFSGAEDFVSKYKDQTKDKGIIGHFGLGFYSSFMVAKKVEIISKSYQDGAHTIRWECNGSPNYTLEKHTTERQRGTDIILHISEDSKEFLEESRISQLLEKYCKFMAVPIKFGEKEIEVPKETETTEALKDAAEGEEKKDKKKETEKKKVANIINNPHPAWQKKPTELKEEDYQAFYRELYPMSFDQPLFQIHLNIDHPFKLTGILYFPKINNFQIQRDKIHLYQNQVFVTDNLEGIVPEFLTFLKGVIDSPDIPLNVSRSYLQADQAVKQISGYISRKVSDKLLSMFKSDRKGFEEKWHEIKMVIEYGMISDEKFSEKAMQFLLLPSIDDEFFTLDEVKEKVKDTQQNKDKKTVLLYATQKDDQYHYIETAKNKGYQVLVLDSPIITHLLQTLEFKNQDIVFARVDSDHIDKLIESKTALDISKLNEEEEKKVKEILEANIDKSKFSLQLENMATTDAPLTITIPEFMRRMNDMQRMNQGMMGQNLMENYTLVVNKNHALMTKILQETDEEKRKEVITQAMDLAMLSQSLLKGEKLTAFINRSISMIS